MNELFGTFIFFFAVIDLIGTIPVFIVGTSGCEESEKRRLP